MKGVTVKLPDDLERKVVYKARELGVSKSDVVREALARYLAGPEPSDGPSAYDLGKDWIGSYEGPEDLSTNPKYLEGFGRLKSRPRTDD